VKHTEIGLLGMSKRKGYQHTNECQFYVTTTSPLSFLDNKYVVFGRVISGMRAFKIIEKLDIVNEKPVIAVKIAASGEFRVSKGKGMSPKKKKE
jgi:cyclophilin family peptidyl-prolyl cis-trans isomerase